MKKTSLAALTIAALALYQPVAAENLPVEFTQSGASDFGLRSHIEYQASGNAYPNFWVTFPNQNSTTPEAAADGEKVYESGTLDVTISGPNSYSYTATLTTTPAFPAAESHAWCHLGVLDTPGTYSMTVDVTMTLAAGGTQSASFSGSFEIPELEPALEFNADLVKKDGVEARINYNANLLNFDGDVTYVIDLIEGNDPEANPVQTKEEKADAFIITDVNQGNEYTYTVKATAQFNGNVLTASRTFTWTQEGEQPSITYTLTPTAKGCDFEYTIEDGIYSPYSNTYLVCLLTGGEQFNEDAKYHSTEKSGTIHVEFDGNELGIWLKAAVYAMGTTEIHTNDWDKAIVLKKLEVKAPEIQLALETGEFVRTSSTGGTLEYKITATGDIDQIDHYVVWASRVGDENMNVTETTETEGKLVLTVLPENASTPIWPKVKAVFKNGAESATVQTATTVSTISKDAPKFSMEVYNPTGVTETSGTVDYRMTMIAGEENLKEFEIYVVYKGATRAEGDVEVARIKTTEKEGTITLTNLPHKAETEIWVKAVAHGHDGSKSEEVTYPGAEQEWHGFTIDTSNVETAVETIGTDNGVVDVYTVTGVLLRKGVSLSEAFENLPAGIYIVNGKKYLVK